MMHDGRVIVEGTPAEIRANETVHDLYLGRGYHMSEPARSAVETPLLEIAGLNAYYGSAQALEDVTFSMGRESVAIVGRNGMGKTTLCDAIMGISPPRASGSIRFEGRELVGQPSYKIARARNRLRAPGATPVPVAHGRPAPEDRDPRRRRTEASGRASGSTTCSRDSPSASETAARSCRAASSRCSRSGGRSSTNPKILDHGRAVRGARAGGHRGLDRDVQDARGGRSGDPAHRAEPRRRDGARRASARHDRRRDRGSRRRRPSSRAIPTCSAGTSASSRSRTRLPILARCDPALALASSSPLVTALVCAGCGGDDEARPDLAFVSTRDGDYAIFEMNADGSAQRRLTTPRASSSPARLFFQVEPAWSPDGRGSRSRAGAPGRSTST